MRLRLLVAALGSVGLGVQAFLLPPARPKPGTYCAVRTSSPPALGAAAKDGSEPVIQLSKLPDLSQSAFPDIPDEPYDLIVLGSGPAGETAAVKAAQKGQSVAVVEVKKSFGGPTGLTSKAVREAAKRIIKTVEQVGGDRDRQIRRLWKRRFPTLKSEAEVYQALETRDRLTKNGCDLYVGAALLVKDPFDDSGELVTVRVCRPTGCVELQARYVIIATGSRPNRPKELRPGLQIPFTSRKVIDATQMANLKDLPESLAVIGGGVIAVEYASVLAQLGVPATVLCKEDAFLPFLPQELRDAIKQSMLREGIEIHHAPIKSFEVGNDKVVRMELENRMLVEADVVLYSGGRDANTEKIGCENVGVTVGKYGRVQVDEDFRTTNPRIFAIGDVIGPPGLASYAQQSARVVTDLLFGLRAEEEARRNQKTPELKLEDWIDDDFFTQAAAAEEEEDRERTRQLELLNRMEAPLTLWTVPEISSVGLSADQAVANGFKLASEGGDVVVGYAYFKDLARGRLSGDLNGFLKVISRYEGANRHVILGFHVVGDGANELIQLGQVLVNARTTLEELSNSPFAAVTLSCLYQVAADDALCNSPYGQLMRPSKAGKQGPPLKKPALLTAP